MSSRARVVPGLLVGLVVVLVTAALTGSVQVGATAATQSGSTTLSAPYVQPGGRPASSDKAKLVGTVRFTPARKGRPVRHPAVLGRHHLGRRRPPGSRTHRAW